MCLTIPKQVLSAKNDIVAVKSSQGKQEVGTIIKVRKGDWVLTQNNVIVAKISQKQAKEINNIFNKTKKWTRVKKD